VGVAVSSVVRLQVPARLLDNSSSDPTVELLPALLGLVRTSNYYWQPLLLRLGQPLKQGEFEKLSQTKM
jgi:hypothetical protein